MALFGSNSISSRPPLEALYAYILVGFIGFAVADLSLLKVRPMMLPDKAPPAKPKIISKKPINYIGSYRVIETKNIFHTGDIPDALADEGKEKLGPGIDGPAVESQLPVELLGTIVHINPKKSVASLDLKNQNKSISVKAEEEIPNLLEVISIERRKIIFRNLNNSRKEFVEIPEDSKITFAGTPKPKKEPEAQIAQTGKFDFDIKRDDIEKYTSDLSSILRQARMLPNTVNGEVQGFRFVSIQPGSIYEKLGFKVNDIIKGVNGEPVNSPSKAMELYQALKTSDNVKLEIMRDGKSQTMNYNVK